MKAGKGHMLSLPSCCVKPKKRLHYQTLSEGVLLQFCILLTLLLLLLLLLLFQLPPPPNPQIFQVVASKLSQPSCHFQVVAAKLLPRTGHRYIVLLDKSTEIIIKSNIRPKQKFFWAKVSFHECLGYFLNL